MSKACSKCHEVKGVEDFYKHPRAADGRRGDCKKCVLESRRKRYANEPEYRDRVKLRSTQVAAERGATPRITRAPLTCAECAKTMQRGRTSRPQGEARCLPCRREALVPVIRKTAPPERWQCAQCGKDCERRATRGQRPKLCQGCRHDGGWISDQRRLSLYERDGWHCWLCDEAVDAKLRGTHSKWRPSLDHVNPRSLGGGDEDANLKTSHWICNASRGNRVANPVAA